MIFSHEKEIESGIDSINEIVVFEAQKQLFWSIEERLHASYGLNSGLPLSTSGH